MGAETRPPAGHAGEPGRRTWTSGLSTSEFACLRAAGFAPVGQVMGAGVYNLIPQFFGPARISSRSANDFIFGDVDEASSFAESTDGWADDDITLIPTALYAARSTAMREMRAECRALGGDGIVAVHVEIGPFRGEKHTLAFQVSGTAVRAQGNVRPARPFTSDLSAQEFAKLIESGWVPVKLVLGAALSPLPEWSVARRRVRRHVDALVRNLHNGLEIGQRSGAAARARRTARSELERLAGRSADGIVISRCDLEVREMDHRRFVEAKFLGTAIAGFGASRPRRPREPTELEKLIPALRLPPDPPPPSAATHTKPVLHLSDEPDDP